MDFNDKILGQNIKKAREAKGWTQERLAGEIGYSQEAVAGWEGGRRAIKPEPLYLIAHALSVSVGTLFGQDDSKFISWDPKSGRLERCVECFALDHKMGAAHCSRCGEQLAFSGCRGFIEQRDEYGNFERREACCEIIPPGQTHCHQCGEPSVWLEMAQRIPEAQYYQPPDQLALPEPPLGPARVIAIGPSSDSAIRQEEAPASQEPPWRELLTAMNRLHARLDAAGFPEGTATSEPLQQTPYARARGSAQDARAILAPAPTTDADARGHAAEGA